MCGLLCLQFLLSTFVKKLTQQIIISQLVVLRRFAAQFIGGTNNPKQVTTSFIVSWQFSWDFDVNIVVNYSLPSLNCLLIKKIVKFLPCM